MASKSKDKKSKKTKVSKTESLIKLYSFFHMALIVYAAIISFRCNKGLQVVQMGLAIMCPHLYLFYIAATKGLSFCLLTNSESDESVGEEEE